MPTANPILVYSPAGAVLQEVSPAVVTTPTVDEEATSPSPIITYPGGGFQAGEFPPPSVYSQAGTTQLINGQSYIDVAFGTTQTDANWVLVECSVTNTADPSPLNIWPGIITERTAAGFTLQLNGMPDSNNYYLHWAVSGVNITPGPATSYRLYGPSSGPPEDAIFTIALHPSTTLESTVTVTLDDNGAGGSFSPATVELSNSSPSQTVTYTPVTYGAVTISATNDFALTDPADIIYTVTAPTYTLIGPSSGDIGVASTNFTVEVFGAVVGSMIVTPGDGGGGGTFTPTTVTLTAVATSATFTYTPASGGTKTISVTNDAGLANPGAVSYNAVAPFVPTDLAGLKLWLKADALALTDGAAVTAWNDSGPSGYNMTGSAATYRTNIINAKPVVRFNGTTSVLSNASDISVLQPYTLFVVGSASVAGTESQFIHGSGVLLSVFTNNKFYLYAGAVAMDSATIDTAFHVFAGVISSSSATGYIDGILRMGPASVGGNGVGTINLLNATGLFFPGDIAEVLIYNSALSTTNRELVEDYLRVKYGL